MAKRKRPGEDDPQTPSKKHRNDANSKLELRRLSDELVLKILVLLPVSELATVQRCVDLCVQGSVLAYRLGFAADCKDLRVTLSCGSRNTTHDGFDPAPCEFPVSRTQTRHRPSSILLSSPNGSTIATL